MSGLRFYALGFVGFLRYGLLSWFVELSRMGCAVTTPSAAGLRVVGAARERDHRGQLRWPRL